MSEQPAISFKAVRVDLASASGVAIDGEVDVAAVPALERALEAAIETTAGGLWSTSRVWSSWTAAACLRC